MGYIYCITNKINGKQYIGQTKHDDNTRLKEHFQIAEHTKRNLHLYNAIRKYGKDNFEITILKNNLLEDELDKWEIYYIGKYNTFENGYNNTLGGGGIRGYHHSEETKQKISENHNPNIYTKERAEKISFANKGKPKSEEHKRKLSECAKQRVGEKNPFYGKHHKKETIMNNSIAHRKYVFIQIDLVTGLELNRFNSIQDVCKYIVDNNLSKAKESSIAYRIYTTIYGNQSSAYGYGWIGEKCNDYPDRE